MDIAEVINPSSWCGARLFDPATEEAISESRLAEVFPPSLAAVDLSTSERISIPHPLREAYARFRPTPMFEAREFAAAVDPRSEILVKDEGASPSGNHKMNSALWVAYHCARDGVRTVTTETTGNWGLALALAARPMDLQVLCFLDSQSARERPDRQRLMEEAGADVVVVPGGEESGDLLGLSANRAVKATQEIEGARYIFGSVYNYFVAPQTMSGMEARKELQEVQPDLVVGSCGGGANLLGIAATYLLDRLEGKAAPEVLCAESELCPILSEGVWGRYSIDDHGYYPLLETYGLTRLRGSDYIGGLGSTIVAGSVAEFHRRGLLRSMSFSKEEAASAARLFEQTEGRQVALETGYQLAAVIRAVREQRARRVLVNISTVGRAGYA